MYCQSLKRAEKLTATFDLWSLRGETKHYFRFEGAREWYQWARTSRTKIRAVIGPMFLNS